MEKVYLQYWEESSRTFGITPDGCSLHLLMCDVNTYIESIYNGRENIIPEEYDRIVGDPIVVMISSSIFNELLKANSIRIDETSLNNMSRLNDIKIMFQDEYSI